MCHPPAALLWCLCAFRRRHHPHHGALQSVGRFAQRVEPGVGLSGLGAQIGGPRIMNNTAVAFGLFASTVALKAKCGHLTDRWRADLAQKALEFVWDDDAARLAVLAFMITSRESPEAAGESLLDFVCVWIGSRSPKHVGMVLRHIEAEPEYEWQKRADLQ